MKHNFNHLWYRCFGLGMNGAFYWSTQAGHSFPDYDRMTRLN